jgi:hypothetical protein
MDDMKIVRASMRSELIQLGSSLGMTVDLASGEMLMATRSFLGVLGEDGGWATGGFTTKLVEAMMEADLWNRARLGAAYPELMTAVVLYKDAPDGRALLIRLATRGNPVAEARI